MSYVSIKERLIYLSEKCIDMYKCKVKNITNNRNWKTYQRITTGFSNDLKYLVTDSSDKKYLIRISQSSLNNKKMMEKRFLDSIRELNFNKTICYECSLFNNNKNIFSLYSWVDGEILKNKISKMSYQDKYVFGIQAGKILKKMHSVNIDNKDNISIVQIRSRRAKKMLLYMNSKIKISNDNLLINFINDNISNLYNFEPKYIHHDFHLGNLVLNNGAIGVIDFDKTIVEDPILDLVKLQIFDVEDGSDFCMGVLDGYFNNDIPNHFWIRYAVLTAYNCITLSLWASSKGLSEVLKINKIIKNLLNEYNNFENYIPNWYYNKAIKNNANQFNFNKEFTIEIDETNN